MVTGQRRVVVNEGFVGLLYQNGAYVKTLKPGAYRTQSGFFDSTIRRIVPIDMRERSITIKGQEILTADKVAIRVSLLVYFKIRDAAAAAHNVGSYEDRIYEDVQLAARRFLASRELDAILSDRNEISDAVRDALKESALSYGVEILRADVKDLVFPGNLREIMNQVLETERRAEAQLIKARKDAEANRITAEAANQALADKLEAERESHRVRAETEIELATRKLEYELRTAEAFVRTPHLLRLREFETLQAMARAGAKFSVGLSGEAFKKLLAEPSDGADDHKGDAGA